MQIDITNFTKQELIELNRLIIDRIKYLSKKENFDILAKFKFGDLVQIQNGDALCSGVVIKVNIKTVSICLTSGETWRVSPNVVKKVEFPSKELLKFQNDLLDPKVPFSVVFDILTDKSFAKDK